MKRLILFVAVFISLASFGQNKIIIRNNALNRVDSNIYVPQYQLDTAKINIRNTKQDTMWRIAGTDSIYFKINGRQHAIKDSSGGGGGQTLTISSPLTGTSYNGSAPVTIGIQVASSSQNGYATTNQITSSLGCTVDGQGGVVSTGSKGFVTIPYACTITNWYVSADVSGTIQFDIKRSGTSIVGGGGNKPALSSAISGNAAVSGWTSTSVSAGDILEWVIDSSPAPATLTNVTLVLKVIK